jgi:two-component system phosphate regulon response regulator PhoB
MNYILTIEDEPDIRDLIVHHVSSAGYKVRGVASAEEGIQSALSNPPLLILLDILLPGMNGIECCRKLRLSSSLGKVPIIIITAKGTDHEIAAGLEAGADDYIVKPFNFKVLVARIKAVLRRTSSEDEFDDLYADSIQKGNIEIFPIKREVQVDHKPVKLTFSEFEVLRLMLTRPGRVFTRTQIINSIRGQDYPVSDRSVDVIMTTLRKKLGREGDSIETLRGVGYRFCEND